MNKIHLFVTFTWTSGSCVLSRFIESSYPLQPGMHVCIFEDGCTVEIFRVTMLIDGDIMAITQNALPNKLVTEKCAKEILEGLHGKISGLWSLESGKLPL